MPETNPNLISENLSITVTLENNGYYLCQLSNPLQDPSQNNISCYGQTQEHAIAIALEQLAEQYRQIAEEQQNLDMLTVERSADGEAISKLYHVTLNFGMLCPQTHTVTAIAGSTIACITGNSQRS